MSLRPQQNKLDTLIKEIEKGSPVNEIFLYWVPGAGKSLVAPIVSQLIKDEFTKILWTVPRAALSEQGEFDFRNSGHFDVGDKNIRQADNYGDPFRGLCGAVVSYQAISASPERWINISKQYKLILILDEYDSLIDSSAWVKPVTEMYNNSILRIPMTGTLDRSDSVKVSFVPYINKKVDFTETKTRKWIIYDNKQALKDGSILPFESILINGSGTYIDKKGDHKAFSQFDGDSNQLKCAFETEYALHTIQSALSHWNEYKQYFQWSKILIVAPDIGTAKIYLNWLKNENCRPGIATSEEPEAAKQTIRSFKLDNSNPKSLNCLISVAMIYKGLNVPPCTHEVFLTIIRGSAWCEQAIGRIRRRYKEKTEGFFFAPNDPKMLSVLEKIEGGKLSIANGTPSYKKKKNKNPFGEKETIQAIESKAEILNIPYSVQEKTVREEINLMINKYVGEQSVKTFNGEKKYVHTESMKRRKILWYRIYIAIGRKCQLKEMTMDEMNKAKDLIKTLTN